MTQPEIYKEFECLCVEYEGTAITFLDQEEISNRGVNLLLLTQRRRVVNTTISISTNRFVALWIVLVMLLLAVLFLLLKPEKPQDVLFTAIANGDSVPLSEQTIKFFDDHGYHTIIGLNAERKMGFFEASTGNAIDVCNANAGEESNTLTNQKTYGSQSAANESCQLSARILQQLSGCPWYCETTCNVSGVTKCAHSKNGKKYRACHKSPTAPAGHVECQ